MCVWPPFGAQSKGVYKVVRRGGCFGGLLSPGVLRSEAEQRFIPLRSWTSIDDDHLASSSSVSHAAHVMADGEPLMLRGLYDEPLSFVTKSLPSELGVDSSLPRVDTALIDRSFPQDRSLCATQQWPIRDGSAARRAAHMYASCRKLILS